MTILPHLEAFSAAHASRPAGPPLPSPRRWAYGEAASSVPRAVGGQCRGVGAFGIAFPRRDPGFCRPATFCGTGRAVGAGGARARVRRQFLELGGVGGHGAFTRRPSLTRGVDGGIGRHSYGRETAGIPPLAGFEPAPRSPPRPGPNRFEIGPRGYSRFASPAPGPGRHHNWVRGDRTPRAGLNRRSRAAPSVRISDGASFRAVICHDRGRKGAALRPILSPPEPSMARPTTACRRPRARAVRPPTSAKTPPSRQAAVPDAAPAPPPQPAASRVPLPRRRTAPVDDPSLTSPAPPLPPRLPSPRLPFQAPPRRPVADSSRPGPPSPVDDLLGSRPTSVRRQADLFQPTGPFGLTPPRRATDAPPPLRRQADSRPAWSENPIRVMRQSSVTAMDERLVSRSRTSSP